MHSLSDAPSPAVVMELASDSGKPTVALTVF